MEEKLTPHLEELKRVLEDKVTEDELMKQLDLYLNVYRVDISSAKRGILKKYGVTDDGSISGFVTGAAVEKKIGELTGSEQNVDLVAKVLFAEKRDVQIKGSNRTIVSGILGDETGTASFTIWDGENCNIEKDIVYRFKNAYTKLWNDNVQINFGNRCVITKEDIEIKTPERQISYTPSIAKVNEIKEGIGNVTVDGKILSIECRQIQIKGEDRVVYSGMLADETGKIQFSAWQDFDIKEGDCVSIQNAYIRGWRGIPQLNMAEKTTVTKIEDKFENLTFTVNSKKTIGDLLNSGGGLDIEISGTVVDLRSGSGLIKRCPECNRSIIGDECLSHGKVEPVPDLRMKIVVDDGTGAISSVLNRQLTEKLTLITLNMATDLSKSRGESEIVAKSIAEKILIKHVTLRGNVMSDDYGPMMIVKEAELENLNIQSEAEKLLSKIEETLR